MLRSSLDKGSVFAANNIERQVGNVFIRRYEEYTNAAVSVVPGLVEGTWLRLRKVGNNVSSYYSQDGVTWILTQEESVALGETFFVGIGGVTSEESPLTELQVDSVIVSLSDPSEMMF